MRHPGGVHVSKRMQANAAGAFNMFCSLWCATRESDKGQTGVQWDFFGLNGMVKTLCYMKPKFSCHYIDKSQVFKYSV
jgi:hypothetical protein